MAKTLLERGANIIMFVADQATLVMPDEVFAAWSDECLG